MAESSALERESINVVLSPPARAIIEGMREETGVPKVEATRRIFEWFASLPLELRLAVLNRNDDARRRLLKTVVEEMAGGAADAGDVPATEEQAIRIARRMLARLEQLRAGRTNVDQDEARAKKGRR